MQVNYTCSVLAYLYISYEDGMWLPKRQDKNILIGDIRKCHPYGCASYGRTQKSLSIYSSFLFSVMYLCVCFLEGWK